MRKLMMVLVAVAVCAVVSGCAPYSGALVSLPKVQDAESSELIIIRESTSFQCFVPIIIQLDGINVFSITNGAYVIFKIKAEEHVVSALLYGGEIRGESSIRVSLKPGHLNQ